MTELTERLAARAQAPATQGATVADLLERQKDQIARALPAHLSADRFARIVLTECRRNPKLMACTPASLLGALMQAAQLGIEPGPLQQCYLVPYGTEVTFIVGYRGYIDLFRRSGDASTIVARAVHEGDLYELDYGAQEDHLLHRPARDGSRGKAYTYYGVARFKDGSVLLHEMPRAEVEDHRARSRAKSSGPWVTDFDAMARKTVIRAMSPYLPLSADVAAALEADDSVYEWKAGTPLHRQEDDLPALPPAELPGAPNAARGLMDSENAAAGGSGDAFPSESPAAAPAAEAAEPVPVADSEPAPPLWMEGWADNDEATGALDALAERIRNLDDAGRAEVKAVGFPWPMDRVSYETMVEIVDQIEAAAAALPAALSEPGGAPPKEGGAVGPPGSPFADWPVERLRAEVDRLGLPADRRSRKGMAEALQRHTEGPEPTLLGEEPY